MNDKFRVFLLALIIFAGCDDQPEFEVTNSNGLAVYPNPIITDLNISINSQSSQATLKVFDTKGKIMLDEKIAPGVWRQFNVSVENKPSGIYHVVFSSGSGTITKKILKP